MATRRTRINPFPVPGRPPSRGRRYRENRAIVIANARRCFWCKCPISNALPPQHPRKATAEHLIPRSKGGPDTLENMVAACYRCNTSRGNRDAPKPKQTDYRVDGTEEW